jgi:hypothetical protein
MPARNPVPLDFAIIPKHARYMKKLPLHQRWAIPMVRYRILANRIRYIESEIYIGLKKTRFPISDPIGFDNTLQSRKVYIQTSKSTWTRPETDQIPMKGKS